jgi:hypothetical protein
LLPHQEEKSPMTAMTRAKAAAQRAERGEQAAFAEEAAPCGKSLPTTTPPTFSWHLQGPEEGRTRSRRTAKGMLAATESCATATRPTPPTLLLPLLPLPTLLPFGLLAAVFLAAASPTNPPNRLPKAQEAAKSAASAPAATSVNPSSCSHSVANSMAFHGIDPITPCATTTRKLGMRATAWRAARVSWR